MPYSHGLPVSDVADYYLGHFTPSSMMASTDAGSASAVWSSANRAFYYPVRVLRPVRVLHAYWENGAAVSGNVDMGLYDRVGTRLVSTGSTAQAGTSVRQTVDITDTLIGVGIFYVAIAMDNTTGAMVSRTENTPFMRFMGVFTQASAFPLPATATFATPAAGRVFLAAFVCRTVI